MRFALFYHSLVSDWNHGNAHFLRGVARELQKLGHRVDVYEPEGNWSLTNLVQDQGAEAVAAFHGAYPDLQGHFYRPETIDLDAVLDDVDVVIMHEWNAHDFVSRVGRHRSSGGRYRLLFHDTHHRSVTDASSMAAYDLAGYDGVLAFGRVIRDLYLRKKWAKRVWTWHEAADTDLFRPLSEPREGDLVWIGNWGDAERTQGLHEYLLGPVRALNLKARVHGVRYPEAGRQALRDAGIDYAGWLPNFRAPEVFARHRVTVHVPRRPYREQLHGIPTIRVFEALACGVPLVSAPWSDAERLFTPGKDYLVVHSGPEMERALGAVLNDPDGLAKELARHGRHTILARHTCAHRVAELLEICRELEPPVEEPDIAGATPAAPATAPCI